MHDDLERLARMRAKKRVDSWGEQCKSPWQWLSVVVGFYSFLAMLVTWTSWANGNLDLFVPVLTVLVAGLVIWILYRLRKAWERKRLEELYEEELLKFKVKGNMRGAERRKDS